MLTGFQAEIIALFGEGVVFHTHCAAERYSTLTAEKAEMGYANAAGLTPSCRYAVESDWPEGLTCDYCCEWIVEPSDYDDES